MKAFTIVLLFTFCYLQGTTQVFVIQRGAEMLTFNNLNIAFDSLETNDELYIPGGTFELNFPGCNPQNLGIPQNVKIFGAGHYPEYTTATGKTILTHALTQGCATPYFNIGQDCLVQGIQFNFRVRISSNASISYCSVAHLVPTGEGMSISRNVIGKICSEQCSYL